MTAAIQILTERMGMLRSVSGLASTQHGALHRGLRPCFPSLSHREGALGQGQSPDEVRQEIEDLKDIIADLRERESDLKADAELHGRRKEIVLEAMGRLQEAMAGAGGQQAADAAAAASAFDKPKVPATVRAAWGGVFARDWGAPYLSCVGTCRPVPRSRT